MGVLTPEEMAELEREMTIPTTPTSDNSYERHKERVLKRQAERVKAANEIGPYHPPRDQHRREVCEADLARFARTYFPATFSLPFSRDHHKIIEQIQVSILEGGLFALAMPRGSGKSSICEAATIWAVLYGHRQYVVFVGSDVSRAEIALDGIKTSLRFSDLLHEDFGEVTHPIRSLNGMANRTRSQTINGQHTLISWGGAEELILPTVQGSRSSGSVIRAVGITAGIRGLLHTRADGTKIRPDQVVIDDPQTDGSAASLIQCESRERVIAGAILGLAGPGRKIAAVMPCTVIREGDLASRMLDRDLHPEWHGVRTKLLYAFPENEKLWAKYAELRRDGLRAGDGGRAATEFYRHHQAEMDKGAEAAWPERYNPDEISAIQHGMNLKLLDEAAFFAEYQNEPKSASQVEDLTPTELLNRLNRHTRGWSPTGTTLLTAFIDVQQDLLFYSVVAWSHNFTGWLIDYGTFPQQHKPVFKLREASPTLTQATGIKSLEGSVFAGLTALTSDILGRAWPLEGGGDLKIDRCLIDAGWGLTTDVVYKFCRQSPFGVSLTPSHGRAVGAAQNSIGDWQKKPSERRGLNWIMPAPKPQRVRHILFDTNWWKSFLVSRLKAGLGEQSSLSFFGDDPAAHTMLVEHLLAETRVQTFGRGRAVEEWKLRPHRPDNHLLDCLVGCCVGASMGGASLATHDEPAKPGATARKLREAFQKLKGGGMDGQSRRSSEKTG